MIRSLLVVFVLLFPGLVTAGVPKLLGPFKLGITIKKFRTIAKSKKWKEVKGTLGGRMTKHEKVCFYKSFRFIEGKNSKRVFWDFHFRKGRLFWVEKDLDGGGAKISIDSIGKRKKIKRFERLLRKKYGWSKVKNIDKYSYFRIFKNGTREFRIRFHIDRSYYLEIENFSLKKRRPYTKVKKCEKGFRKDNFENKMNKLLP